MSDEIKQAVKEALKESGISGWMTAEQAAAYLSIDRNTFYQYRNSRNPPKGCQIGSKFRYKASDLDEWMQDNGGRLKLVETPTHRKMKKAI